MPSKLGYLAAVLESTSGTGLTRIRLPETESNLIAHDQI